MMVSYREFKVAHLCVRDEYGTLKWLLDGKDVTRNLHRVDLRFPNGNMSHFRVIWNKEFTRIQDMGATQVVEQDIAYVEFDIHGIVIKHRLDELVSEHGVSIGNTSE